MYTEDQEPHFQEHDEIQWATRIKHSSGSISYLERKDKEDCLQDLEDFAPGRVEIIARVVRYFDWEVHERN